MTWYSRALSLSPGNEQTLYWGGGGVTEPGSRNWMGMDVPGGRGDDRRDADGRAIRPTSAPRSQALDRILTAGRYVIPIWHSPVARIAHSSDLHYPDRLPLYGDWPGFQPEVWWHEN